ncbi:MoaD/ThiS family protein [Neoactinobaculum massilliense]|uniref:MoaD/ThiS family protein n=1 Tax=Neoactinobaculum massilliense TaxID=2364794 RepID=UPI000F530945|nr:hypothetical protein [Neoactinobaculum massilliense]
MARVAVRYFGSLIEAAGVRDEIIEVPDGIAARELRAELSLGNSAYFMRLIMAASLVMDGKQLADDAPVSGRGLITIDVMPPKW